MLEQLNALVRDVPDFPKPGIVFKDFTPLMADARALALAVELMANPFRCMNIELVVGAESRGFIFGTAVAQAISAGFVPVRKAKKLPAKVIGVDYALEYGTDRLEMHADSIKPGQRVLVVDDLLATGGTLRACCQLVKQARAEIVGITVLIELGVLKGAEKVREFGSVHSVLKY